MRIDLKMSRWFRNILIPLFYNVSIYISFIKHYRHLTIIICFQRLALENSNVRGEWVLQLSFGLHQSENSNLTRFDYYPHEIHTNSMSQQSECGVSCQI